MRGLGDAFDQLQELRVALPSARHGQRFVKDHVAVIRHERRGEDSGVEIVLGKPFAVEDSQVEIPETGVALFLRHGGNSRVNGVDVIPVNDADVRHSLPSPRAFPQPVQVRTRSLKRSQCKTR